ncbi:MAG TPA: YggS family pyridoxal phosphate-dependent enzyme [Usitatibacter sp.]|nr:YggS family pyridoxal phosphate-dependent enzyme [Usitatibacter sp.]
MPPIASNLQALSSRIAAAMQGEPRAVTLVAVSKQQPVEAIRDAYSAGCRDFGESYVQEALPKLAALRDLPIAWHFIGHLQGNKVRDVAAAFDWVHGVDREKIAGALARARPAEKGPLNVCLQVNISGEGTKGGVAPAATGELAKAVAALQRLKLRGLMGMASATSDPAEQRRQFALLRATFDDLVRSGFDLDTLSMGMSQDLDAAVAEGATMVRVGTAIFGERLMHSPSPLGEGRGEGQRL